MHVDLEAIWLMLGRRTGTSPRPSHGCRVVAGARRSGTLSDGASVTLEVVRIAALLIQPVMPDSARETSRPVGQLEGQRDFTAVAIRLFRARRYPRPTGVFPPSAGRLTFLPIPPGFPTPSRLGPKRHATSGDR